MLKTDISILRGLAFLLKLGFDTVFFFHFYNQSLSQTRTLSNPTREYSSHFLALACTIDLERFSTRSLQLIDEVFSHFLGISSH